MRKLLYVALLVVALCGGVQARTLYQLTWQSEIPIDVDSISVDVRGSNGRVIASANTPDATEGYVWIDADRSCVSVAWRAETVTGVAVNIVRRWDAECERVYLPILAQDTPFGASR